MPHFRCFSLERILLSCLTVFILLQLCLFVSTGSIALSSEAFRINVRDSENDWPVPMVEFRTTHGVRFISDNHGVIAFYLDELMGRECWFAIEGHGYGVEPDGFGYRGIRLTPQRGSQVTVTINRKLPAKRLGRLTGSGQFAQIRKFEQFSAPPESGVLGCDSIQIALHKGKIFWAWGDTTVSRYPLGLFHMSSATTSLNPYSALKPPMTLNYSYFSDENGNPRNVAQMPGDGPTWLSGFVSIPDQFGNHHLVATYAKIRGFLSVYELGLCVWNDQSQRFKKHRVLWKRESEQDTPPPVPDGHPAFWNDDQGTRWLLFGDPFPRMKLKPLFESWEDPASWLHLEPQKNVPALNLDLNVVPHRGSIAWNNFRKCWVSVFTQLEGEASHLGEIWYAESGQPTGPWRDAVHIVTHNKYSFYNPRIHTETSGTPPSVLLFEGTFTKEFSKTQDPVPKYNYNQILYRLDLDDPSLFQKN